jgi:hypothetical protein
MGIDLELTQRDYTEAGLLSLPVPDEVLQEPLRLWLGVGLGTDLPLLAGFVIIPEVVNAIGTLGEEHWKHPFLVGVVAKVVALRRETAGGIFSYIPNFVGPAGLEPATR